MCEAFHQFVKMIYENLDESGVRLARQIVKSSCNRLRVYSRAECQEIGSQQ